MRKGIQFLFASLLISMILSTPVGGAEKGGSIYGKILDSQNNPVPGATVRIDDHEFVTKNDGIYFIEQITSGTYELVIRKNDQEITHSITVKSGEHLEHNVFGFDSDYEQSFYNELGMKNVIIPNVGINVYASVAPHNHMLATEVFATRTNGVDIWLIDTTGKKLQEVVTSDADESNPRWSPDGEKILYQTRGKEGYRIWIKNLSEGEPKLIDYGLTPAWARDGTHIVYAKYSAGNSDIYMKDLNTGNTVRLTTHPARDQYPYWGLVNGRDQIVFASRRGDSNNQIYDIWIMNPDGSDKRRLTTIGTSINQRMVGPVISPDGQRIAFWEIDYENDHSVWLIDPVGSEPVEFVKQAANPEWSPGNPDVIYFNSKFSGRSQIWRTRIP